MAPEIAEPPSAFDCAVIGGGPAGMVAAIALARTGARVALVARQAPYADNRTTALLGGSIEFLDDLGVWPQCQEDAAALEGMRLVDDTGRLIRAPEVRFSCHEIGLEAFGYNIANRSLIAALELRAAEFGNLRRFDDEAGSVVVGADDVAIQTTTGQYLTARLVVGADGRHSLCRHAAGIQITRRELNQTALTFNITHSRPHGNVSTEFHTAQGPCVFVPLPGLRSSVVWVTSPSHADQLALLNDEELSAAVEKQSHFILGRMRVEPGRSVFQLAIERPQSFARDRIALVGEAAHVVPPIGAQGLNLGLRDAADIAKLAGEAIMAGRDPGAPEVLVRYDRARRPDILSRTFVVDMANRSLLNDLLPLQPARAIGMHLLGAIGPLRRLAMREGLAPGWRR
jgi:2-octaprenyl-6-methoxyphenol hydroxylase